MANRLPHDEGELEGDPNEWTIHVGFGGSSWPAAEKAGLVNAGGMWMTPEGLERMRALRREQAKKKRRRS